MGRKPMTDDEAREICLIELAKMARSDAEDNFGGLGIGTRDLPTMKRASIKLAVELYGRAGVPACRHCACTEDDACEGGCAWIAGDVCSSRPCADAWKKWQAAVKRAAKKGARRGR